MRIGMTLAAVGALASCTAPQTPQAPAAQAPAAPFVAPMNPAAMTCRQATASGSALEFSAGWVTGQLRAASLSGLIAGPVRPEPETATALGAFCAANPAATLANAVPALSAG